MKIGIAGFPGAGKTTIFNALTGLTADVGVAGSGATRPNLGVIKIPDRRVDALAEIFSPRKRTYAEVSFVDFPDPPGEVGRLDEKVIVQMREVDALAHVVRAFEDPTQVTEADPLRDLDRFQTELIVADLALVERRLGRLRREKGKERERELLERLQASLDAGQELRSLDLTHEEQASLSGFSFLSLKPRLVVVNLAENAVAQGIPPRLAAAIVATGLASVPISGKLEMELAVLDETDRRAFETEVGLSESARDRFLRASYELLDLMSFLTAGEDEVRAWTIRRGDRAQVAAGKIHGDIARGFIRAEVVSVEDLLALRSESRCREAGKLRIEGKEYVVRDGDVIHFRFNV